MKTRRIIGASVALIMGATVATGAEIELKLSHFLPSVHGLQQELLEPWIAQLAEKTDGQVEVNIYPAGSSFGHIARQLDQVEAGIVDLAMGLAAVPRDRLPHLELVDIPLIASDRAALNKAVWEITDEYIRQDFKGVKLLGLMNDCAVMHTREKEINTLADIKGLRMRVPSVLGSKILAAAGAVPVNIPSPELYSNLEKGVVDGMVTVWDFISTMKFNEVTSSHLDNTFLCGTMWFGMNEAKYNAMPENVRAAIDAISGDALMAGLDDMFDPWIKAGIDSATAKGNSITRLSDADEDALKALAAPIIEEHLAAVEARGVSDIREAYAALVDAIAKQEAMQ